MANLKGLQRYLNYEFSIGCYAGEDYKSFERKYINYLKDMCKENGWEFVWGHKNHYNFTACFSYRGKYVYFSITDVRYWKNQWYYHILYRSMKHEKDYTGGRNCYTDLPHLKEAISRLFERMCLCG